MVKTPRFSLALLGWPILLLDCTTFVSADFESIGCEADGVYGPPACDEGAQCIAHECTPVDAPPLECCSSFDCEASLVCHPLPFASSTGFLCVSPAVYGHAPPGELLAGAECFEAAECRSGSCTDGHCIDTCCVSADCPAECLEGVCAS